MKTVLACVGLVLLAGAATTGQTAPGNAATPTFRARTELVTVPVVVTRAGKHVSGLSKEQFSVAEDGQARTIAFFEEVKTRKQPVRRVAATPGVYTNELGQEAGTVGLTIIVVDAVNTPALAQANARKQIIKFLSRSLETDEPTMLLILTRDGMKVVHDFTTDPAVLVAALKRAALTMEGQHIGPADLAANDELTGATSLDNAVDVTKEGIDLNEFVNGAPGKGGLTQVAAAEALGRVRSTMASLANVARAVQGIPGRKTLLWATGGIQCEAGPYSAELSATCEQTWNSFSSANVAVYPIEVFPADNPGYTGPGYALPTRPRSSMQTLYTMSFAEYTGGNTCSFRTDLDTCFKQAMEDSSAYYLLGYYAKPVEKSVWRKLRVKVNAEGTHVRSRTGYFSVGSSVNDEERRKLDVAWAALSPVDYTALPMRVRWTGTVLNAGKRKQAFEVRVDAHSLTLDTDADNHLKLNVMAVAQDATGKTIADVTQTVDAHLKPENAAKVVAGGLRYTNGLDVPPGEYTVKFIIRDALSGRMGTVSAPLKVTP